jgi:DNA-binding IclR family transcriptional regulator
VNTYPVVVEDKPTQVLARAGALLRAIAACEADGASTTKLARTAGVPRPTTHRLLTALSGEGLVDRDLTTGRWSLGPELYLLGAGAASRYDITEQSRDIVERLARHTGESAFLSARRGDETVCIANQEGSFPLRSHVLHVGIRFPLGVASAGLAILSHLPDADIDDYFTRAELETYWGPAHSQSSIRSRIVASRGTGYAVNPGLLVEGSWGIGAAVFDRNGRATWALSITGVETRFRADRIAELGKLLLDQAHELTTRLN